MDLSDNGFTLSSLNGAVSSGLSLKQFGISIFDFFTGYFRKPLSEADKIDSLEGILETNFRMKKLDLSGNEISRQVLAQLEEAVDNMCDQEEQWHADTQIEMDSELPRSVLHQRHLSAATAPYIAIDIGAPSVSMQITRP